MLAALGCAAVVLDISVRTLLVENDLSVERTAKYRSRFIARATSANYGKR
jgi:hypothetical protein